jgi:hypothetical protein
MSEAPREPEYHLNFEAANELQEQLQRVRHILARLAAGIAVVERGRPPHEQDLVEGKHVRQAAEKLLGPAAAMAALETMDHPRPGDAVFISHATPDADAALELASRLRRAKVSCFVAKQSIATSAEWAVTIWHAIRDCQVLVALVSEAFARSDWCQAEVGAALGQRKVIVPALLHGTAIPRLLSHLQAAPAQTDSQKRELTKRIKALCVA